MSRLNLNRALAATAIGTGGGGFYWLHFVSGIEWTREAFQGYVGELGSIGPIVLVAAMAMRPFLGLPSALILLTAGFLFGTLVGTVYGTLGGALGALIALGTARALGRDFVQGRIGGALVVFDEYITRRGAPWLAAYTALPVSVLSPVFFTAGVSRIPVVAFGLAVAVGFVPRAALYAFLGNAVLVPSRTNLILASALVALAALGVYLVRPYLFPPRTAAPRDRRPGNRPSAEPSP